MTSYDDAFELEFGLLQHKVLEKIGEEEINVIVLIGAEVTTPTFHEALTTFSQLNIAKSGLNRLKLSRFEPTLAEPISTQVMEEFAGYCK